MDKQSSSNIGSTKVMATIAVMTALTCIFGPLSIPIGPIPISLTPFCVFFSVYVLGMKKGTIAVLLYLLIAGVIMIVIAAGNEWRKRHSSDGKRLFKEWKW